MMSKLKIEIKIVQGLKTITLLFPTDDQKFYQILTEFWKRNGKKKRKEFFCASIPIGGNLKYIHPRHLIDKNFYLAARRREISISWVDKRPKKYNSFISLEFNNDLKKKFLVILWRFIDFPNFYDSEGEEELIKRLERLFS